MRRDSSAVAAGFVRSAAALVGLLLVAFGSNIALTSIGAGVVLANGAIVVLDRLGQGRLLIGSRPPTHVIAFAVFAIGALTRTEWVLFTGLGALAALVIDRAIRTYQAQPGDASASDA